MADESFLVGPARVNESYMNTGKVISIAKEAKVDGIHPGYGFFSEDYQFAEKCQSEGFIFIGPKSNVIKKMGSKIAARKAMEAAGVPVVPGSSQAIADENEAIKLANEIGYPIMLKASLGGGGIGMQAVHSDAELLKAFEGNSKRAATFFGDGSMFLEKKIENARHIEIQLLADHHGNVIHLFERDCSIQRRNQKVIEEAPTAFISETTRKKMGEAAINAATTLGYTNAGTIEFLVDENENFYFLEMNTRIQVEHPVTEEITGLDIVEKQIQIADGEKLAIEQKDIKIKGHAIEVRIYAEDPVTFFPSPGHIDVIEYPEGENIRNELAVTKDYDVTPFYDPMIAKLIVKGTSREKAIEQLIEAINNYKITGIKTNIPMLEKIVNHEVFQNGNITTAFITEHYLPLTN